MRIKWNVLTRMAITILIGISFILPGNAYTILVTSLKDDNNASQGMTLRLAIEMANLTLLSGVNTIDLSNLEGNIFLKSDLPAICCNLVIQGPEIKDVTINGVDKYRLCSLLSLDQ